MTEANGTHEEFIRALYSLNQTMKALFERGDVALFPEMNAEVKELYRIQRGSEDPVMKALDIECGIIYNNFDMIVAVLRTVEDGEIDRGAQTAINKFLHNIDEAVVNIASALGLV